MERSAMTEVYARSSCTPPQVMWRLCEIATAILMNRFDADNGCVPWPVQLPRWCLACGQRPRQGTHEPAPDKPGGNCLRAVKRKRFEFSDTVRASYKTRGTLSDGAFANASSVHQVEQAVGTQAARTTQSLCQQAQSSSAGSQFDDSDYSDGTFTNASSACTVRISERSRCADRACIAPCACDHTGERGAI